MAESEQREINAKGRIEVSDELCGDGTEALVFITADEDEYVIRNKKAVKHLKKYAYLDDVEITIHGLVKRSTDGIDVLGVLGFDVPKSVRAQLQNTAELDDDADDEPSVPQGRKHKNRMLSLDEAEDLIDEASEEMQVSRKGSRRR